MKMRTGTALLVVALLALPLMARAQEATKLPPTINVTGVGEVKVKPDIARLSVGVETLDKDAGKAVQRNAAQADAVIKAIRALGVRESDIQTSGFDLSSEYTEDKDPKFKGYKVSNTVTVTLRKIEDVGKTLDAAVKAGANVANSVSFDVNDTDKAKAEEEATLKAVADAKRQAILLAKASGIKEIELYILSKTSGFGAGIPEWRAANIPASNIAPATPTPVAPGRIGITASVTAIYRFVSPGPVVIP